MGTEEHAKRPPCRMTTLCYLEQDGKYLMLHRVTKKNDENKDKWIGVGGHAEEGESPEDCLLREVEEETGLRLAEFAFRGLVTFVSDTWGTEYMCLYTASRWEGSLQEAQMDRCREGVLRWVDKEEACRLPVWEGDKIFFRLLQTETGFFSLKLRYEGERLAEAALNGKPMELLAEVTPDGEPTGLVRERGVAHTDGMLHATAHVWVTRPGKNGGAQVLLQKRSMEKDGYPGCWDISAAGHVPAGSSCLETAVRELREELGIRAEEGDLEPAGFYITEWDTRFHGKRFFDRERAAVYLYRKPVDETKLSLQKEEVEQVQWMDYETCLKKLEENSFEHCLNPKEFRELGNHLFYHVHEFEPVWNADSRILILGTFPSVKSREQGFYYGHPRNRFWQVVAAIAGEPAPETIQQKKEMLLRNGIAIWDVIAGCRIQGSSDASIRDVEPADVAGLLKQTSIERIYANGSAAKDLYDRYLKESCGREIIKLPSTSPANAAWSLEKLTEKWRELLHFTEN